MLFSRMGGGLGLSLTRIAPPQGGGGGIPDGFLAVTQDGEQVTYNGEPVWVADGIPEGFSAITFNDEMVTVDGWPIYVEDA